MSDRPSQETSPIPIPANTTWPNPNPPVAGSGAGGAGVATETATVGVVEGARRTWRSSWVGDGSGAAATATAVFGGGPISHSGAPVATGGTDVGVTSGGGGGV